MDDARPCSECQAPIGPTEPRCPRCDALAPTAPSRPLAALDGEERAKQPRAWLRVFGSSAAIEVDRPLLIGRGPAADLRLAGPNVSRRHALVLIEDATYRLVDMGATNGVYLNGERVADAVLREGDVIRVGWYALTFTFVEPAPSMPKAA